MLGSRVITQLLHEELHHLLSNFDVDFDDLADVVIRAQHVFSVRLGQNYMKRFFNFFKI